MAEITKLEQQKKDANRVNVYIDGSFYCGLGLDAIVKYRIKPGMEVDEAMLDAIQMESEKEKALDKALTHLSATLKTEKQMRDFLMGKGYTEPVVEYVIEKLSLFGYVNDESYCRAYVNSVSGKGKRYLEQELRRRGIASSIIDRVLDEVEEDEDELFEVLKKYLRGKEFTQANLSKAFRYLMSKGYEYDLIKSAVERLKDEFDEDDPL